MSRDWWPQWQLQMLWSRLKCGIGIVSRHRGTETTMPWIYSSFHTFFFLDIPGINPVGVEEIQTVHGSKLNYMELSQAIHPIIGIPFMQLHPCLSQELLQGMPIRWEEQENN